MELGGRQHRFWLWWWELPGGGLWLRLGFDPVWSVNEGGLVSWPGRIRCLFRPHADDGYGCCCYCGAWRTAANPCWRRR